MKRLILFELIVLFLATTFESDSPPGWYQQVLPVNDQINDIFFLDSLTGWVVTDGRTNTNDTGYVMKTTDGGINWAIQYNQPMKLNVVQFLDANVGYVAGGSGSGTARIFKTINGGLNWNLINSTGFGDMEDLFFINKDTGWVCDAQTFGGLAKTTNGGINWQPQLGDTFSPKKLYFLNQDTGWFAGQNTRLYFTTNGGQVWNLQFTFASSIPNLFFVNRDTGYTSSFKTTNGGFNWIAMNNNQGGSGLFFLNNTIGYNCAGFSVLQKTIDGQNWYNQTVPTGNGFLSIQFIDTFKGWSGGSILIHTTDGGGPFVGIQQISTEEPSEYELYQNYPNPFNPKTNFRFRIANIGLVTIEIFDITGKEIATVVNEELRPGEYQADWNASGYSSGIYFYSLSIDGKVIDTKKMILIK